MRDHPVEKKEKEVQDVEADNVRGNGQINAVRDVQ
tara:strand:+ start:186 stop:290 length:105 start_codon:yes stop_codon:yes gene_type:complete